MISSHSIPVKAINNDLQGNACTYLCSDVSHAIHSNRDNSPYTCAEGYRGVISCHIVSNLCSTFDLAFYFPMKWNIFDYFITELDSSQDLAQGMSDKLFLFASEGHKNWYLYGQEICLQDLDLMKFLRIHIRH